MTMEIEKKLYLQTQEAVKIVSTRGNCMLIYKGYKYYKKKTTKTYTLWACYLKNCPGSFKTPINTLLINDVSIHNHSSLTVSELRILLVRELMVEKSKSTRYNMNEIIGMGTQVLDDSERQQVPVAANLKRSLRNTLHKENNFSYKKNYDIPCELLTSRSGHLFVQYDNYQDSNTNRMIAIWSKKNIETAKNKTIFSFDGTFNVCPKPFYQLFIGFYIEDNKSTPFVYFFLPDKTTTTYEKALGLLKNNAGVSRLDNVIIDFEKAMETAFKNTYPHTKLRYCVFHYSQAVYRNIQSKGLANVYRDDTTFRFHIKCILCTIFIPTVYRRYCVDLLMSDLLTDYTLCGLKEFCDYFIATWIENNYFIEDDMKVRIIDGIPFTNNGAEGYNSSLRNEIRSCNPSLTEVLICLRNRDFMSEMVIYESSNMNKKNTMASANKLKLLNLISNINKDNLLQNLRLICGLYNFKCEGE